MSQQGGEVNGNGTIFFIVRVENSTSTQVGTGFFASFLIGVKMGMYCGIQTNQVECLKIESVLRRGDFNKPINLGGNEDK